MFLVSFLVFLVSFLVFLVSFLVFLVSFLVFLVLVLEKSTDFTFSDFNHVCLCSCFLVSSWCS